MAADSEEGTLLQSAPFHSKVDVGFWHKLSSLKLNKIGIDDSPVPITGFYAPCSHPQVSVHLTVLAESLPSEVPVDSSALALNYGNRNKCPVPGTLYNTNTLEGFETFDTQSLLKAEAKKIWDDIHSGKVEENSSLLLRFIVLSFADLKNWHFYYCFALPILLLDPPARMVSLRPVSQCLSSEQAESLSNACNQWRTTTSTAGVPFFLVSIASNSLVSIRQLSDWEACQRDGDKVLFGFYDPCHLPSNPGWPLHNYLAYICTSWGLEKINILCYRETRRGFMDSGLSLIGEVVVSVSQGWKSHEQLPNVVGWEDYKGESSQCVKLAESMDPKSLAISAADLNLKLMKWRSFPSLNLSILSSTRCLLLGAGTLGCQVARMLMGWGVRKITMVDSGRVAMSNPLRQSLYTFDDSMNGGKFKAEAAVQSLGRIFHAVEAEGIVMAIPMPGHPVPVQEEQNVLQDCRQLQELVEHHDAIFLLTDTRESRWLPSLLCSTANKITITAGLGFESFVVMRHGAGPLSNVEASKAANMNNLSSELGSLSISNRESRQRLGCYFCNDVVAPIDSTTNLTLDQQCTVTRPGLAPIASALAVELLVGILHHPSGISADAEFSTDNAKEGSPLGILPHQIRGSLSQFSQTTLVGHASSCCTACSRTVVEEYQKRGLDFVLEAINNPMYLEDLTGLTELKNSSTSLNLDWDVDSDDDKDDFLEI